MGVGEVAGATGEAGEVGQGHAEVAVLGSWWRGLGQTLGLGGMKFLPGKIGGTRLLF